MKSVLISIQPKWCELIATGEKTVEIRKTKPKLETPFKCYIYCTKAKPGDLSMCPDQDGKIIGEFVCDKIYEIKNHGSSFVIANDSVITNHVAKESCLNFTDMRAYLGNKNGYAWHISNLVIYEEPKELSGFFLACNKPQGTDCSKCTDLKESSCKQITRPPQSWCYVEETT